MEKEGNSAGRSQVILTFIVLLVSSLVRLVIAFALVAGVWVSSVELVVNVALGICLFWTRRWAAGGLALIAVLNLVYFFFRGVIQEEWLLAMYEIATSLCLLMALTGIPSKARTYWAVGLYAALLALLCLSAWYVAGHRPILEQIITEAHPVRDVRAGQGYTVNADLPWKVLSPEQAHSLFGADVRQADLRLVRDDGSAFGLLFPLNFQPVTYTPEIGIELQREITDGWLNDLKAWESYPMPAGFLLSAKGQVGRTPLSYVIFYKHFGNLGLYGVFWGLLADRSRLLSETGAFYSALEAKPLKERLTALTSAEIYAKNQEAVVLINVFDQSDKLVHRGSGFNVSPKGIIVTNLHLLHEGMRAEVVFPVHGSYDHVRVAAIGSQNLDLTLLLLDGEDLPTIKALQSVPAEVGDGVYVLGNPQGMLNRISEGKIGAVHQTEAGVTYQITAENPIDVSGGPVLNLYGEVIGVAESPDNEAIAIEELRRLRFLPTPITLKQLNDA